MIHKIERIASVGRFRNFTAAGDIAFRKLTLIYSDNGLGKTTLAAIIRSLSENKVEIIKKRVTTNSETPQTVQIIQRTGTTDTYHTYRPTGWSNLFSNIEIFDIHFVNDNVYSGFTFDNAHGQNLHQFAIGAAGVQIRNEIERNKADKATKRALIERIKETIIQQVGFGTTESELNALVNLTEDSAANIESRIATAETSLINAQANQVIQSLQILAPLTAINVSINFVDLTRDLQTTIEGIQEEALQQLFQNHCRHLAAGALTNPETWIRQGFNFIQERNQNREDTICPFCGQSVLEIDLIRSYAQMFNAAFRNFISRLESHRSSLQAFNLDASVQRVNLTHNQNPPRILSWEPYLRTFTRPDLVFMPETEVIQTALERLGQSIDSKISNPSVAIQTHSVAEFQTLLQAINNGVNRYNQIVQEFNSAIARFRTSITTVSHAQIELNRLNRIRQRFNAEVITSITELITEQGNLQGLETSYRSLVEQQEATANTFFTQYSSSVNRYLRQVFRTPYQIENVQNIRPQGRGVQSRFDYTLTINGQPISFDHNAANNVRDCLSEGDKSTLALAFFLSKIENDLSRSNKVIVLDDPLSSFDKNRRFQTISELLKLFRDSTQLIILSHDGKFLYDLNRRIRRSSDKKGLRISYDETNTTSIIQSFDIEKSLQNDYFICIDKIKDFIENGVDAEKRETRREIRIALEYYLIFKFYNQLGSVEGTFGTLIERLSVLMSNGSIHFRDTNGQSVLDDLSELNEISWDSHHGDGDLFETSTEIPIEQITLSEFKTYLQMTLDLINNRI